MDPWVGVQDIGLRTATRGLRGAAVQRRLSTDPSRLQALLDPAEWSLCGRRRRPAEGIAARLAAKRGLLALLSARRRELCLGVEPGLRPLSCLARVTLLPDALGRPQLRASGEVARRLEAAGLVQLQASLTHTAEWAGALVLAAVRPGSRKRTLF